jgi:hypothetical protein
MKKNILFIIVIALLFIIMYWINRENPEQFVWNPTYDMNDKQPYGAYAFDKLLETSWEEEYIHSYESVTDLFYYDEIMKDKNLLILCRQLQMTDSDLEYLLEYIQKGGNALIAADEFSSGLKDSLYFFLRDNYFYFLPQNLSLEQARTSVYFYNSSSKDSVQGIAQSMISQYFVLDSIAGKKVYTVAVDSENHPVMLRYKLGEGNLILSCTPLLFTNYAVLNDSIHPFIWQSLAYLKEKPLVRTEHYENDIYDGNSNSAFRYLLSQPSLKWAFYIVLITIILFMIFTAKRKQKPIPVLTSPPNKMLDFVRSISALYLMKNNNADIILKKYIYWGDELRKKYGIDIINEEHDKTFIRQFSAKTGMPEEDARHLFLELDGIREYTFVSDKEMMDLITKMKID